jgi:BirA family transcriptional regulator, biotin operon repressor / biotin---[acetyl-CoA-carboxylase] ligase
MTTDTQLLSVLRGAEDGFTTGAELARQLGLASAVVSGRIKELRKLGYEIEASPHLGYRLVGSPDALHAEDLLARLPKKRIVGRDIQVFQETASTNDVVEKLARDGVKEGVVVFAESQTKGRGRLGRKWVSPAKKGLWFSVLLRPPIRPIEATQLTVAAATALARAIQKQTNVSPDIKWPNDLLLRGRKVAGILTELNAEVDRVKHIILGIGLDVNQTASDFPAEVRKLATSLKLECGRAFDRAELAAAILQELDRDYARVCAGEFAAVADEWESRCTTIGQNVTVLMGDRRIRGRAESLDDDGSLLVRTEHGRLERIIGGDVTVEK